MEFVVAMSFCMVLEKIKEKGRKYMLNLMFDVVFGL